MVRLRSSVAPVAFAGGTHSGGATVVFPRSVYRILILMVTRASVPTPNDPLDGWATSNRWTNPNRPTAASTSASSVGSERVPRGVPVTREAVRPPWSIRSTRLR